MNICKLGDIAKFTTGKLNSNAAQDNGKYPFFTCAPEALKIDDYAFDTEAIILAGNNADGNFHIQHFKGKFNAYQRTYVIESSDENKVYTKYLYYALKTCLLHFKQISQGSATKFLTAKILNSFELPIPEIEIQKKIAGTLGNLDKKIKTNEAINENLCDQMKAIYLHAKKSSIWNECKLGEILTFYDHMRKPLSSRQREGMVRLYPYYGATSVVDYVDAYIFDGVYILISEDGANVVDALGHPLIQYTYGKFWVNNHAHIVQGNMFYSEALLFALLKTLNMSSIVTGAAQPKINQANLKDFCIVAPSNQEAMHLSNVLNPFLEQIIKNDLQNTILSNLRDTLLPRLMSGELDISNLDI